MGGFISKAKAVPVEKKPEPEELEKPVSGDEQKEMQNPEGSAKVTEDPIAEEAGGDMMDELVGQAGKMSIEEEDAPRPVEPEPEKELYTTCTDVEDKDNHAKTAVDQSQDVMEASKDDETGESSIAQEVPLVNIESTPETQIDIQEGSKAEEAIDEVSEKSEIAESVDEQAARPTTPSLDEIASFDKSSLKATETAEKSALPTVGDIAQEKLPQEIDAFDKAALRQVETEEKGILPTLPQIAQEKTLEEITSFDKSNLQPVPITEPMHEELVVPDDEISKATSSEEVCPTENMEQLINFD